jgi:hypothetical protein
MISTVPSAVPLLYLTGKSGAMRGRGDALPGSGPGRGTAGVGAGAMNCGGRGDELRGPGRCTAGAGTMHCGGRDNALRGPGQCTAGTGTMHCRGRDNALRGSGQCTAERTRKFADVVLAMCSNKFKLVILDECDAMTKDAQFALRRGKQASPQTVKY